jgi:hypothetical protein
MTGSVTFTPVETDYIAAVRANYLHRLAARRFWVRAALAIACAVAVLAGVVFVFDGDRNAVMVASLSGGIGGAIGLLVCIGIAFAMLPRRTARLFRQQRTIHQRFDYSWTDYGLSFRSDTASGETPWSDFRGWRETGPAFLIYMNDSLFQFLPRRALTPEAADDLRATLEQSGLPIY